MSEELNVDDISAAQLTVASAEKLRKVIFAKMKEKRRRYVEEGLVISHDRSGKKDEESEVI